MRKLKWPPSEESMSCMEDSEKRIFVWDMVNEFLQSSLDSAVSIEKKSIIFVGYLFAVLTAIAGVFFSGEKSLIFLSEDIVQFVLFVIAVLYSSLIALNVCFCIIPREFSAKGNTPRELLGNEAFMKQDFWRMRAGQIAAYQNRIDRNMLNNERAAAILQISVIAAAVAPLSCLIFSVACLRGWV